MPMKNYKLEDEDGHIAYRQFEDDDEGLQALRDAVKDKNHPLKSVAAGEPTAINAK